eukprot:Selendium_serpulae@DN5506_c0_g1_i2.p1
MMISNKSTEVTGSKHRDDGNNNRSRVYRDDEEKKGPIPNESLPEREPVTLMDILPPLRDSSRRVFFVRHGESMYNQLGRLQGGSQRYNSSLNEAGRTQVQATAAQLGPLPVDLIACSPLRRATQTAEIITSRHPSARRVVAADFGEMKFGDYEGLKFRQTNHPLLDKFHVTNELMATDKSLRWPGDGGESVSCVEVRVKRGLDSLLKEYPDARNIVIASHSRLIRIALGMLLGNSFKEYKQANACVNCLEVDGSGQWRSITVNHITY